MIRVLNIISDTNLGGAGRVLLNYAKYRDRSRFDMSVILPRGSVLRDMLEPMDIPVYEIDGMADRSFDRADVGKLKEMIRRIDPDIVHTHGSLSGRIAARACGKKIVYTRHCAFPVKSYMRHGPGRWANRIFNMHYADRVIAVGESTKENLMESGIPEKYIDTMMNGSEKVTLPPEEERRKLRRQYGFSDEDFVMGILARIEVYKGHDDILDALSLLISEGLSVKLIIAGTGSYEEKLREKAAAFPEGTVVFAGFIRDISQILAVMDVQINASYESGDIQPFGHRRHERRSSFRGQRLRRKSRSHRGRCQRICLSGPRQRGAGGLRPEDGVGSVSLRQTEGRRPASLRRAFYGEKICGKRGSGIRKADAVNMTADMLAEETSA